MHCLPQFSQSPVREITVRKKTRSSEQSADSEVGTLVPVLEANGARAQSLTYVRCEYLSQLLRRYAYTYEYKTRPDNDELGAFRRLYAYR